MRLIDAEKLCLHLADIQLANRGWKDDYCEVLDDIISIIDEQTTIEAEPVRHGRWVQLSYGCYTDGNLVYDEWECSECHFRCSGEGEPYLNYCPHCGAKMRGEADE